MDAHRDVAAAVRDQTDVLERANRDAKEQTERDEWRASQEAAEMQRAAEERQEEMERAAEDHAERIEQALADQAAEVRETIAKQHEIVAESLRKEAAHLLEAGVPDEAAQKLRMAVQQHGTRIELRVLLARALFESGKSGDAAEELRRSARLLAKVPYKPGAAELFKQVFVYGQGPVTGRVQADTLLAQVVLRFAERHVALFVLAWKAGGAALAAELASVACVCDLHFAALMGGSGDPRELPDALRVQAARAALRLTEELQKELAAKVASEQREEASERAANEAREQAKSAQQAVDRKHLNTCVTVFGLAAAVAGASVTHTYASFRPEHRWEAYCEGAGLMGVAAALCGLAVLFSSDTDCAKRGKPLTIVLWLFVKGPLQALVGAIGAPLVPFFLFREAESMFRYEAKRTWGLAVAAVLVGALVGSFSSHDVPIASAQPMVQATTPPPEPVPMQAPAEVEARLASEDATFTDARGGAGWGDRCLVHYKNQELPEAKAACLRGLDSSPKANIRGAILYNLGLVEKAGGHPALAHERFEQSLQARPGNSTVKRALASVSGQ